MANPAKQIEQGIRACVQGDYVAAVAKLWPMANRGYPRAQYALGLMYARGQGVPKDGEQAIRLLKKAAEVDHVLAQYSLGVIYDKGWFGLANEDLAVEWYRKAAARGQNQAKERIRALRGESETAIESPCPPRQPSPTIANQVAPSTDTTATSLSSKDLIEPEKRAARFINGRSLEDAGKLDFMELSSALLCLLTATAALFVIRLYQEHKYYLFGLFLFVGLMSWFMAATIWANRAREFGGEDWADMHALTHRSIIVFISYGSVLGFVFACFAYAMFPT